MARKRPWADWRHSLRHCTPYHTHGNLEVTIVDLANWLVSHTVSLLECGLLCAGGLTQVSPNGLAPGALGGAVMTDHGAPRQGRSMEIRRLGGA